jgi:carbon storage regulator CsrA
MLVLTRREGDSVILETSDGPIEVTVEDINGQQVRVGFEASKSVKILRGELKEPERTESE